MRMITTITSWLRIKLLGLKPGIDIDVHGTVAIVRFDCGHMTPRKAEEFVQECATKLFTDEVKKAMGYTNYIFIPVRK